MFTREDMSKVYKYMVRQERRGLADVWGVTLANCTRYCSEKVNNRKFDRVRWTKMLNMWSVDVWMARLAEANELDKIISGDYVSTDPDFIRIDIIIPGGKGCVVTVNGRELT